VQVFSSCALSQAFSNLQKQSRIALDAPFCTTNRLGLFVCHSDASGLSLHSRTHVLEYCNYCNWHDDIWTLLVDGTSIFMYIRFLLIRRTAQMSLAFCDLECSWISKKSCPTARCTEDNIWPGRGRRFRGELWFQSWGKSHAVAVDLILNHSGILEYSRGYGSALVLELYADRTAHEFLVRILRDGQPLKLGLCDDKASCGVLVDGCGCINRQSNAGKAPKCRFNRQVSPKSNIK